MIYISFKVNRHNSLFYTMVICVPTTILLPHNNGTCQTKIDASLRQFEILVSLTPKMGRYPAK